MLEFLYQRLSIRLGLSFSHFYPLYRCLALFAGAIATPILIPLYITDARADKLNWFEYKLFYLLVKVRAGIE